MADLDRNKQTVIAFITRAFNDNQPADAVAQYVGSEYIQHDPQSPDGAEAFIQFVNGFVGQFPHHVLIGAVRRSPSLHAHVCAPHGASGAQTWA